ncbi:hypothetical protein PIB30_073855, partial [Stylosanthes scabra]|nr:hypothetical protein [Stylosanthes scabra]
GSKSSPHHAVCLAKAVNGKLPQSPPIPGFSFKASHSVSGVGVPRDEIVNIQEQNMYCPYGDWKGEQPQVRRGRLIPPPQAPPAPQEEQYPPSPPPQPIASEIFASSVQRPPEPSLREVMRYLHRQERLQINTQSMLRNVFLHTTFRNLLPVTSSKDDSDPES